jgi:hypothetical protein
MDIDALEIARGLWQESHAGGAKRKVSNAGGSVDHRPTDDIATRRTAAKRPL